MTQPLLFQKIALRGVSAKNRILISPMCQYSALDGVANDWHLVHLGKFAQGGASIECGRPGSNPGQPRGDLSSASYQAPCGT